MTQVAIDKGVDVGVPTQPRRALGLWASTALVIGNMIGSGIFLLPASLAAFGGISIVGWVFTAVGASNPASLARCPGSILLRSRFNGAKSSGCV